VAGSILLFFYKKKRKENKKSNKILPATSACCGVVVRNECRDHFSILKEAPGVVVIDESSTSSLFDTSNGVGKRLDARSSITTSPRAFFKISLAVSSSRDILKKAPAWCSGY
jgi:hypothetical protein